MIHTSSKQFHIILSRMQYITITIFHNSIRHSDIPTTNLSMRIITESICRMKRNDLNISKVFCFPYTLSRVTSRATVCIGAASSPYGRMHLYLPADKAWAASEVLTVIQPATNNLKPN